MSKQAEGPLKQFTVSARILAHDADDAKRRLASTVLPDLAVDDATTIYPFVRHSELRHAVTEVTEIYEGISKIINRDHIADAIAQGYMVAVVWSSGEDHTPEYWLVDGIEGLEQLRKVHPDDSITIDLCNVQSTSRSNNPRRTYGVAV